MAPVRDSDGIRGVERDVFEGFFCPCGGDAFIGLTRRAVDYAEPVPNAFGTNAQIQCAKCHKVYTFRDGRWIDTTPTTLPPRTAKQKAAKKKAMASR